MKRLKLLILFCALMQLVHAQKMQDISGFGFNWNRGAFSTFLTLAPRPDTIFSSTDRSFLKNGSAFFNTTDSLIYIFYNNRFRPIQGSGGGADGNNYPTSLSLSGGTLSLLRSGLSTLTTTVNTSNVTEGTNLYFSTARARASVSQGYGIAYNAATGVIDADTAALFNGFNILSWDNSNLFDSTFWYKTPQREARGKSIIKDWTNSGRGLVDIRAVNDSTISHKLVPKALAVKSVAEMRTLTDFAVTDTQYLVILTDYTRGIIQQYQYDPNDASSVDNGATIIVAGTKRFRAVFPTGVVNVKLFGATGNGSTDDQPAIQNACDVLVANSSLPRTLYFPKGVYRITKPIIIYKWDGTQYQQVNLNLVGQEFQHWNDITTVARIVLTDTASFAIGIQQGRSMVIKGLSIEGPFNPGGGINDAYYKRPWATWASAYGVRDQPYSPLTAIHIDPFSNSASHSCLLMEVIRVMTSWYRGTGSNAGSSGIHVEQCRIFGFTVGISISLNSWTQNGEDMVFRDNAITICKAAYASGQLQTKDNFIYNGITDDRVYCILSGDYGSGHGCQPYIVGYNVAGAVISLVHGLSSQFPVSLQNIFAEGLYQIGDATTGAGTTEILNSNLDFSLFTTPIPVPPYHWKGDNAKFKGCTMRYYDDSLNKRLYFNGGQIMFDNCWFDKPPIGKYDQGLSNVPLFSFNECKTGNNELIGWRSIKGELNIPGYKITKQGVVDVFDDQGTFTLGGQGLRSLHMHFDFGGLNRFAGVASGVTVTVDTTARQASFTIAAGAAALIAAGDYVMYGPAHDSLLGKITSVNYSTGAIAVTNVPIGVKTGTNYDMVAEYYEIARGANIGHPTNGSTTIDSVKFLPLLGLPQVGDRANMGYPGAIITAINATDYIISTGAYYTRSQDYGPMDRSEKIDVTSYYDPSHANLDGWNFLMPKNTIWKIWTSPYTNVQHTYKFYKPGYLHMSTVSGPPTYYQSAWQLTADDNSDVLNIHEGGAFELNKIPTEPSTSPVIITHGADSVLKQITLANLKAALHLWDLQRADSVSTANATPTTLVTYSVPASSTGVLTIDMSGMKSDGSGGITGKKVVRWKKVSGTLTLGSITSLLADEVDAAISGATWTITTSSNNIIVQVTGVAATNIDWKIVGIATIKTETP
jgi:hypothetical protein